MEKRRGGTKINAEKLAEHIGRYCSGPDEALKKIIAYLKQHPQESKHQIFNGLTKNNGRPDVFRKMTKHGRF